MSSTKERDRNWVSPSLVGSEQEKAVVAESHSPNKLWLDRFFRDFPILGVHHMDKFLSGKSSLQIEEELSFICFDHHGCHRQVVFGFVLCVCVCACVLYVGTLQ